MRTHRSLLVVLLICVAATAWGGVTVTVLPQTATVPLNGQQQFTAQVTGTGNQYVTWSLSGSGCYATGCGMISNTGLYKAPATLPNPPTVTVAATSIVDGTKGFATVTLEAPNSISVAISPTSAVVPVNQKQKFTADVSGTGNKAVTWSISGIGCVATSCGTVDSTGLYTAPPVVPMAPQVYVTATSVADSSKSASASVVVTQSMAITVTISPTQVQLPTNGQQQFTAAVTGSDNKTVSWSTFGAGCSGSGCGTISNTGLYTAPSTAPNPPVVSVKAASVADPTKYAIATVTIGSGASIVISPPSANVPVNQQQQFTATVYGGNRQVVVWSLSGQGCAGMACGTISSWGLYAAPSVPPSPPTVAVTATLLSDPKVSASATVTVTSAGLVSVSVSPPEATVDTGSQQQFSATVNGSDNKGVTWSISGFGCVQNTCGTIDPTGLYAAPPDVPNPSYLNVVATSVADPKKSGSAFVVVRAKITVTVSPLSVKLPPGGQQQFTGTVTGNNNKAVTWSVAGPGCSGVGCGTISSNGMYTAPPVPPTPPTVDVTATSQADNSKRGTATVTVAIPIIVTISPPTATVTAGGTQQFTATVTGTDNKDVSWGVKGKGCNGSDCGTVDQTGLYIAPVSLPDPASVTVVATSLADGTSFGTAAVRLVPTTNSKLLGSYAFLLKGHDPFGYAYQVVGRFTADGKGNITGGEEDINSFFGPHSAVPISPGTYDIGGDWRGTMQLQTSFGTTNLAFAITEDGKLGTLISLDPTIMASGNFKQQNPEKIASLDGGFVVRLSGMDLGGGRIGALALLYSTSNGVIAGNSMDVNDAGTSYSTFVGFRGTYTLEPTGRGTMTLGVLGLGSGILDFTFYMVSDTEFYIALSDKVIENSFLVAGYAITQQPRAFSMGSFNGSSIFNIAGNVGSAPDVKVGAFIWDGLGEASMVWDENYGGKVTVGKVWSAIYDMQVNGHGTILVINPNNVFDRPLWYLYAITDNTGFILDSTSPGADIGEVKFQELGPPFENSAMFGNYIFGTADPVVNTVPMFSGSAYFDGSNSNYGKGNVNGGMDENSFDGVEQNQTVEGTYSLSRFGNGRGGMFLTSPESNYAIWVISNSEFLALDTDPSATNPAIWHFQKLVSEGWL